jgi:hypothetical protein
MLLSLRFVGFCLLLLALAAGADAQLPTSGLVVHLSGDGPVTTGGGGAVTSWGDQSGNGNNALPGISPTLVAGSINGLPAVSFNGAVQHLNLPNTNTSLGIANSDYEIFVVGRSSSPAIQFLTAGGTGAGVGQFELHLNGSSGARFIPETPNGADFADLGVVGQFTDGRAHIFNTRVDGDVGRLRVNGMESVLFGGAPADPVANARSAFAGLLTLGVRGDASFSLLGQQAEVVIYDRALTVAERGQVEQYLASKWNAPLNVASQTQGGVAFANEVFAGGGNPSHQIDHLNNGLYGNAESWLGNNTGANTAFAGVAFDGPQTISSLAFGRDATGALADRDLGTYIFQFTRDEFDPLSIASVNGASWQQFLTVTYPGDAPPGQEHLRHQFDFASIIGVTGVRVLLSTNANAIDELEVFGIATVPEPTTWALWSIVALVAAGSSWRQIRRQR